ncbi:MAG: glycoside hydrolase family 30 beta sandwich domain-containing protein [Lachnospiraceae bacterium]
MRITYYVTNEAKQEYWKEHVIEDENCNDCMHVINVYPAFKRQTIEGFGGAFTEASTFNFSLLPQKEQEEILEAYFGKSGLQYNLGRSHIHSCDFALGNYTYIEENDETLRTFSIDHDKDNMIPMMKRAMKKNNEIIFLASPWSPPAFMKTNQDMNHGGKLKKEYYLLWAEYVAKYIKSYREEGIPIRYITVQNEPDAAQTWDSCLYSAKEEGEYLKEALAPALQKAGLSDIGIFIWDHNKEAAFDRADETFQDPEACKAAVGVAVHWYTGDHFDSLRLIKEKYPDKRLIFSEGCVEYSRFSDSGEVQKAEMYAHDMIGNIRAGIEAFYDWNLLLDELGGPNHVGNFCAAPIMCDIKKGNYEKRLSYYYIGHLSRYVKRGARVLETTCYTDKIETVAFENPDGEHVLVLLNKSDTPLEASIREGKSSAGITMEAHTIATILYR